jgi:hypothetical protein
MPKEKREKRPLLIAITKDLVLKYGQDYYREYKLPEIHRIIVSEGDRRNNKKSEYEKIIVILRDIKIKNNEQSIEIRTRKPE